MNTLIDLHYFFVGRKRAGYTLSVCLSVCLIIRNRHVFVNPFFEKYTRISQTKYNITYYIIILYLLSSQMIDFTQAVRFIYAKSPKHKSRYDRIGICYLNSERFAPDKWAYTSLLAFHLMQQAFCLLNSQELLDKFTNLR